MTIPSELPEDIESRLLNIAGNLSVLPEVERERVLSGMVSELSRILHSLVSVTEAERHRLLDRVVRALDEEELRQERIEPLPVPRLGSKEKFLLWHVSGFYSLHSRSCAIQAYYRNAHGLTSRQTRNLRRLMSDDSDYDALQSSFSRAIRSLKAKGLIETFHVKHSLWFADRGRGPEPAKREGMRFFLGELEVVYGGDEGPFRIFNHRCCNRNSLVYRLNVEGTLAVRSMKAADKLPDPYAGFFRRSLAARGVEL